MPSSSITVLLLAVTAAAASPAAPMRVNATAHKWVNGTAVDTTLTTSTSETLPPNSTSALPPTPRPTAWTMECMGGALQVLCGGLCFCDGSPSCNCHYDPTSRCRQMCECIPQV
ncbi:hypothetical protein DL764_002667 [Monosporascus ibericus]|uniref:Uncharacterized protein n=1 Tax=Monosporascus ibericus TaxID=155417 RepID=A0A4Q4TJJ7_9PEZI|nr:hypothetical protein DL764_002667 [Monosporascus ibericus]